MTTENNPNEPPVRAGDSIRPNGSDAKECAAKLDADPTDFESDPQKFGRNVEDIRFHATRVIRGTVPAQVRKELMAAVKAGWLGRLKKDGLKPEIFFHPDHKYGAIDRQNREAAYSAECIAKANGAVMVVIPVEQRVEAILAEVAKQNTSK